MVKQAFSIYKNLESSNWNNHFSLHWIFMFKNVLHIRLMFVVKTLDETGKRHLLPYVSIVDDVAVWCAWYAKIKIPSLWRFYTSILLEWMISSNLGFPFRCFSKCFPSFVLMVFQRNFGWVLEDSYSQLNVSWKSSVIFCFVYQRSSDRISTVSHLILLEKMAAKVLIRFTVFSSTSRSVVGYKCT